MEVSNLQMEFPLVPGSGDFVVLTHDHVLGVEQVTGVLVRNVILTSQSNVKLYFL